MVKFNHEVDSIPESMGISNERSEELQAGIIYEIINQEYLVKTLYEDKNQAPRNLITKSGLIERFLEDASNEAERIYCVFEWTKIETISQTQKMSRLAFMGLELLFHRCNMDKKSFIHQYVEGKRQAMANQDGEEDDD